MKKIISLALVLAMALGTLTACGGSAKTAKVIDIELTSEQYAFGVDKKQPELLTKVNEFIKKIKSDGTLDEICDRYFSNGEPVPVTSATKDDSKDQLVVSTNSAFPLITFLARFSAYFDIGFGSSSSTTSTSEYKSLAPEDE